MVITFILPYAGLSGGIRVVSAYAEILHKRGHQVTVISTPQRFPSIKLRIKSLILGKGWPLVRPTPSYFDGLDFIDHRVLNTCRPVTDADVPDADVIIATWWETAEWVEKLSASKGEKVYFVQGHEVFPYLPIERVKATYLLPLRKVTISQWLVDILKNEYKQTDVALVHNGVDPNLFNAPLRGRQNVPTVGFVYSPAHFKGCDITCKAIRMAREKVPELKVVAFGAQKPTANIPVPEGTEFYFHPGQSKLAQIYASCDAWLFGSRAEGFGLPILEAMACRTPVIATPAGAAPELLTRGGGVLLPSFESKAMADAIVELILASKESWSRKSDEAYKIANSYTWDDATVLFEKTLLKFTEKNILPLRK